MLDTLIPRELLYNAIIQIPSRPNQCFFFSRNIGELTPKNFYFHYLKKSFLDESIQKILDLILKKEALDLIDVSASSDFVLADTSVKSHRKFLNVCV